MYPCYTTIYTMINYEKRCLGVKERGRMEQISPRVISVPQFPLIPCLEHRDNEIISKNVLQMQDPKGYSVVPLWYNQIRDLFCDKVRYV